MSSKTAYDLLIAHVILTGLLGTLHSLSRRITTETGISHEKAESYQAVFDCVYEEIKISANNISTALTDLLELDEADNT